MKVLIAVSDSFCGNFIRGQARYLKEKGNEVVLVSPKGAEVEKIVKSEGCKHIEVSFSREISIINDIKSFFKVIKILLKEKPSIVNAGNPKTGLLFTLAGVFFPSRRIVFTLRGVRSDTLKGVKKEIVRFTEFISCYLADKVIVISPSLFEHAVKIKILKIDKGILIGKGSSNGIDTSKFMLSERNVIKGKKLRDNLSLNQDDILIGFVGRIVRDKGVEELYEAFKIASEKEENLKLILAGPIEENDTISYKVLIEMKQNKNVYFLGKKEDVTEVFAAIDVLVLYSYREGFGNVVLEASSMKRPVIVSDIPGARDTVSDKKSGFLIPLNNIALLSESILIYARNPELRNMHGDYGEKRARKFFKSEVIWEGQLDLYKTLVYET
ncbi:glycosyltransferase family 4 protein [Tenacibaculum tangerinum]|uniref:Glycosyltransferase family 4 protein n=1 Tax=Tenacibaculum tangerinum TaxID=3038772 RepID=A0ABY8L9R5_9FLAO|nr:glycosyltransferase family 4 protein [Tenacibaculum tangerinum]WGH76980.1 glycosyltransferase family 4 protein [Tenacibaculum tangerinum]